MKYKRKVESGYSRYRSRGSRLSSPCLAWIRREGPWCTECRGHLRWSPPCSTRRRCSRCDPSSRSVSARSSPRRISRSCPSHASSSARIKHGTRLIYVLLTLRKRFIACEYSFVARVLSSRILKNCEDLLLLLLYCMRG